MTSGNAEEEDFFHTVDPQQYVRLLTGFLPWQSDVPYGHPGGGERVWVIILRISTAVQYVRLYGFEGILCRYLLTDCLNFTAC